MPRLHLLRSSYDLVVYDFPYDFFDIVGGNKLRRLRLHCLRSPYDFIRRQTWTKPYIDLADIVGSSYSHRVIFTTSSYKSYDARTMTLRKSQGVGTLANQLASQADSLGALIFLGSTYLPSHGTWVARF